MSPEDRAGADDGAGPEDRIAPDGGAGPADAAAEAPRRVRVTAPRSQASRAPSGYPVAREVAEQSEVGQVFVRSLIRSQLRLAVVVAVGFLLILLSAWLYVRTASRNEARYLDLVEEE